MSASAYSDVAAAEGMAKAVRDQDAANIRFFRSQGADVDCRDTHGVSMLMNAVNDGKLTSATALIDAGANVNFAGGPSRWTALHYAAYRTNAAMTQLLLNAKADPNAATPDGERPLHTAAFAGDLDVVTALVTAGADVTVKDGRGHTAMDIATLRAAERFQFANKPFTDVAAYLKAEMERAERRAETDRAQRETVTQDIAVLKSRHPERFRLKPR